MTDLYDVKAPKKSTNLSINSDLLSKARNLEINLSAALEDGLRRRLAEEKGKNWALRNKKAIQSYNEFVDEHGYFGEEYREF